MNGDTWGLGVAAEEAALALLAGAEAQQRGFCSSEKEETDVLVLSTEIWQLAALGTKLFNQSTTKRALQ